MDIYQKPGYKFVALTATDIPAACDFAISAEWESCPVDLGDGITTVFSERRICKYTPDKRDICLHTGGPGSNVFGS